MASGIDVLRRCKKLAGFLILPVLFLSIVLLPVCASSQKFIAVSCDGDTTIALDETGSVWSWGWVYDQADSQSYDQFPDLYHQYIGGAYYRVQEKPIRLPLINVIAISGGNLALIKDGTVMAWGLNDCGQLGDGTNVSTSTPVRVKGLDHVIAISSENRNCLALKNDGTVWSWGYNGNGNVGDGTLIDRWEPVQVKGLINVTAIYGGAFAIKDDGTVWTWGDTILDVDESGKPIDYQVHGDVNKINCKSIPFQVQWMKNILAIDVASTVGVVYASDDGIVCSWGQNMYGRLGDGTVITSDFPFVVKPVQAKGLTDVKAVSAGFGWSLALKNDGTVWGWGYNNAGQFGNGKVNDTEAIPVEIQSLDNVTAISGKDLHAVFLKKDGSVWACGDNHDGSVGYGTVGSNASVTMPVKILGPDIEIQGQPSSNPVNMQNTVQPSQNNNSIAQPINASPKASANSMWPGLGVLVLAIVAFAAGCLVYLNVIRKKR